MTLKATHQPIDTGSAAAKAFLDMLGVFAEFETSLRRERQLEGIKAAKAKGIYKGRKSSIDPAEVRRLREVEKLGPTAIARQLGIGRAEHLRAMGIPVVKDLPVGDFVFDHPFARIELKLRPELKPTDIHARHTNCCVKYSSGLAGGGFADMLIMAFNHGGIGGDLDPAMFGEAGIHVALFEAFSRGQVRLASADPLVDPLVELNMLDDERDLVRLRDGAKRLVQIGSHAGGQGHHP